MIIILLFGFSDNSCNVKHYLLLNEIFTYEKSLDPELCENILEKIDFYNDVCTSQIEILDCG